MRKTILITALMLLTASSALAGMTYDFASRNEKGKGTLTGSAAIEGEMMRLDFQEGDEVMFKDGSVMISRDGGKTFYILDPKKKEYYELDLNQLLSAAGSLLKSMGGMFKLSFENHKVNVTKAGDGGVIEGAILVPLTQLNERMGELDPTRETIVYCAGGFRSSIAASGMVAA